MLEWYTRNQQSISMFIAGWCALATIDCFVQGDYAFTAINAFLVWLNIRLSK